MTWISPSGRQGLLRTAKGFGAIADGNSHPLSSAYPGITLAAAQAAFPNANVTALTQEVDTCALLQLEASFSGQDRYWDPGTYVIDQTVNASANGGALRGSGSTKLQAKAGALTGVPVLALVGQYATYENITVDANCYSGAFGGSYTLLPNGTGAPYCCWAKNCAYANIRGCLFAGASISALWEDTSTGGVSDGATWYSLSVLSSGTLEIWRFDGTATGGTFTITVTNYLGTQTTGNLNFNATGAQIAAALNLLTTIAPTGDQGQVFTSQASGLPANTAGPLGTNPAYIIFGGPMNGDTSIAVTVNTASLTGGTVTRTRVQQGQRGGGVHWGNGVDNSDQEFVKLRALGNFGDGLIFDGGVNSLLTAPDMENNWLCGIRWTSHGAVVLTGNDVHSPYTEGNWQSMMMDSILGGATTTGHTVLRTNQSGTGSVLHKGGTFSIDLASNNAGQLLVNGTAITVP